MLAAAFLHLCLLLPHLAEARRRTSVGDARYSAARAGGDLAFLAASRRGPLSGPFTVHHWKPSTDDRRAPTASGSGPNAWLGASKCPAGSTSLSRSGTPGWGICAAGADRRPPHPPGGPGTLPGLLAATAVGPSHVVDWVKSKRAVLQRAKDALTRPLSHPGSYLSGVCRDYMVSAERRCRLLSREVHTWYLKACNLGFSGLIALGRDPLTNLVQLIGLAYALDWWTGCGPIRARCDLNAVEVFVRGQYYRMLTCLFLHDGLLHMLHNVRSLWALGAEAVGLLGTPRVVALYFASGAIANYVSYVYNFAYANGLPADLYRMTQSVVHGVGQSGRSTGSLVEHVVDRIRAKHAGSAFPAFLLTYTSTALFQLLDGAVRALLPFAYRSGEQPKSRDVEAALNGYIRRKAAKQRGCGASAAIYGLMGAICACHLRFGGGAERRRVLELLAQPVEVALAVGGIGVLDHGVVVAEHAREGRELVVVDQVVSVLADVCSEVEPLRRQLTEHASGQGALQPHDEGGDHADGHARRLVIHEVEVVQEDVGDGGEVEVDDQTQDEKTKLDVYLSRQDAFAERRNEGKQLQRFLAETARLVVERVQHAAQQLLQHLLHESRQLRHQVVLHLQELDLGTRHVEVPLNQIRDSGGHEGPRRGAFLPAHPCLQRLHEKRDRQAAAGDERDVGQQEHEHDQGRLQRRELPRVLVLADGLCNAEHELLESVLGYRQVRRHHGRNQRGDLLYAVVHC
ncbi:rhomboid family intramembrane serine protease [Babesia caballi]|uniref:Rhomboid family intramembrane serine protease n=1 Tax=Babesia caballi TaxID=5871 RepID=A0AAV4LSH2_BABCB|nr:rhomboid family intramembrane serine protease [Babesia caballi]